VSNETPGTRVIKVQQLTAQTPGAVAVLSVRGDVDTVLARCSPPATCMPGQVRLATIGDIDTALIARVDNDHLLLMPHGGPAIIRRTLDWLGDDLIDLAGSTVLPCADHVERVVCNALAMARTPLVLDLLLAQPSRWRAFDNNWTDEDDAHSARLGHLLVPPTVVLVGDPNIGKSTLLNALAGRQAALVHDAPGTTRDHVGAWLNLGGLLVEWIDTPGLRQSDDPVETEAIDIALQRLHNADCCIVAADAASQWPEVDRDVDVRLGLRSDLGKRADADCSCSAHNGDGLDVVVEAVRSVFVLPEDLTSGRPWLLPGLQRPIEE